MRRPASHILAVWLVSLLGVVLFAGLSAAAWLSGTLQLASLGAEVTPMAPATAFSFLALSAALAGRRPSSVDLPRGAALSVAAAAVAGLLPLLVLLRYVGVLPVSVEQMLFPAALREAGVVVGTMSPITAAALALAAGATFLLATRRGGGAASAGGALGLLLAVGGVVLLIGHTYRTPFLSGSGVIPPSLLSSLSIVCAGITAILSAGAASWPLRLFVGPRVEARMLRILMPLALAVAMAQGFASSLFPFRPGRQPSVAALVFVASLVAAVAVVSRAARVLGRSIDHTLEERRRAEAELERTAAALREREGIQRVLFDAAADALFFHDDEGRVLDVNRVACERLGYTREELEAMPLSRLDAPEYAAKNPERMRELFDRGSVLFESAHRAKDGRVIPVEVHARVVEFGGRRAALSVSRDISERKAAERALAAQEERARQGQKMEAVGRLAGGVAHDFNNILTVISGYADLVLEALGPAHPSQAEIAEIKTAAERATALTRQLLAFSRRQILRPEPVDVNDVLRGMHNLLCRLIGEDVQLVTQLDDETGHAIVDRNQLELVIVNLVVNARDAMPGGGRLTLETSAAIVDSEGAAGRSEQRPGTYVVISVSDTGTGIPRETLPLIFEPFFTTKERGKGTGLGLPTAYGIVRQSGGTITVYSEPGRGSTFRVYLPLTHAAPSPAAEPVRPTTVSGTETVLLVEDEDAVRSFAERVFAEQGYTVIVARHGPEALERAAAYGGSIHLLVTDVVMPHMSGRDLATKLTAVRPELRVIYVSGYTKNAIVHHGVLDPGVHFLSKPYDGPAILRMARETLDAE